MSSFGVFFVLIMATFVKNGSCDTEANLLALESSGELIIPRSLALKFSRELKAIRSAYPAVSNIVYSPPWAVGVLLAKVSNDQLEKIRLQYGEVTSSPLSADLTILRFKREYNPKVLAEELISKKWVESAEPDNQIGRQSNIEFNTETGVYTFSKGWGDCTAGCINNHHWEFVVSRPNKVTLLRESGTPLK